MFEKMAKPLPSMSLACGIDIGIENLAISFVELRDGDHVRVIAYKGTLRQVLRFEQGQEVSVINVPTGLQPHIAYLTLLESLPEFCHTVSTVIEMQLASNQSVMSRLDGIAFGFLRGRFPSMSVSLNAPGIRKNFITERIDDGSTVTIPKGYPATKYPSMVYVGTKYPEFYEYIMTHSQLSKIDDICDSIVYASIAALNHALAVMGFRR